MLPQFGKSTSQKLNSYERSGELIAELLQIVTVEYELITCCTPMVNPKSKEKFRCKY